MPVVTKQIRKAYKLLHKRYGVNYFPDTDGNRPVMDITVQYLLAGRGSWTAAKKAFRWMRDRYVDWNEVRIENLYQLELLCQKAKLPLESARDLRAFLAELYEQKNGVDLEWVKSSPLDIFQKIFGKLSKPWYGQFLDNLYRGRHNLPWDPHTERVLERLDLFESGETTPRRKREATVARLENVRDALSMHLVLIEHGKKVCYEEAPRCQRCDLAALCAWGSAQLEADQRSHSSASEKRRKPRTAAAKPAAVAETVSPRPSVPAKAETPVVAEAQPSEDSKAKPDSSSRTTAARDKAPEAKQEERAAAPKAAASSKGKKAASGKSPKATAKKTAKAPTSAKKSSKTSKKVAADSAAPARAKPAKAKASGADKPKKAAQTGADAKPKAKAGKAHGDKPATKSAASRTKSAKRAKASKAAPSPARAAKKASGKSAKSASKKKPARSSASAKKSKPAGSRKT